MALAHIVLAGFDPFSFSIYLSGACGFLMVGGAIFLLATGVIKLAEAGKSNAGLTVEVEKKIKVSTGYPALGLFVIGLIFVALAVYGSKSSEVMPISISGKVSIDDLRKLSVSVQADIPLPYLRPDDDGNLEVVFRPEFQRVWINVAAPEGYTPVVHSYPVTISQLGGQRKIVLPNNMRFTKTSVQAPIEPLRSDVKLAPFVLPSPPQASTQ